MTKTYICDSIQEPLAIHIPMRKNICLLSTNVKYGVGQAIFPPNILNRKGVSLVYLLVYTPATNWIFTAATLLVLITMIRPSPFLNSPISCLDFFK